MGMTKLVCAQKTFPFRGDPDVLDVVLYARADRPTRGGAGDAIREEIARQQLVAAPRAWDFLSIALSVIAADLAGHRSKSPDGWTREFELQVSVADPKFWNSSRELVDKGWIQLFDGQTLFGWQPTGEAKWEVDGDTVRTAGTAPENVKLPSDTPLTKASTVCSWFVQPSSRTRARALPVPWPSPGRSKSPSVGSHQS